MQHGREGTHHCIAQALPTSRTSPTLAPLRQPCAHCGEAVPATAAVYPSLRQAVAPNEHKHEGCCRRAVSRALRLLTVSQVGGPAPPAHPRPARAPQLPGTTGTTLTLQHSLYMTTTQVKDYRKMKKKVTGPTYSTSKLQCNVGPPLTVNCNLMFFCY